MKTAFKIQVYNIYSKYYLVIAGSFAEAENIFRKNHASQTITAIDQLIEAEVVE